MSALCNSRELGKSFAPLLGHSRVKRDRSNKRTSLQGLFRRDFLEWDRFSQIQWGHAKEGDQGKPLLPNASSVSATTQSCCLGPLLSHFFALYNCTRRNAAALSQAMPNTPLYKEYWPLSSQSNWICETKNCRPNPIQLPSTDTAAMKP